MMSQIVGGFLADKFGGAIVMAHCGVIWSLLTYLTPKLVRNRFLDFSESNFYRLQLDAPSDNDDKTNFSRSFPGPPLSVFHLIDR